MAGIDYIYLLFGFKCIAMDSVQYYCQHYPKVSVPYIFKLYDICDVYEVSTNTIKGKAKESNCTCQCDRLFLYILLSAANFFGTVMECVEKLYLVIGALSNRSDIDIAF